MCEEPEVPRRKMPFLNRLFDSMMPLIFLRRSTLTVGTLQLKWHSTEDASQLYSILDVKVSGTSQSPHPKQLFSAQKNEGLSAYQVRPLTTTVFYKSIHFPQWNTSLLKPLKHLPL